VLVPGVLDAGSIAALRAALEPLAAAAAHSRGGYRHLFSKSERVRQLVRGAAFRSLIEPVLGPAAFAVRVHLDDCGPLDGPLRVIPGSHLQGRLSADQTAGFRQRVSEEVCVARAGDALLMRPLLLHASSAAERPSRRRVIHIECASTELPRALEWHTHIP
jgi:hypothetical protein